MKKTLLAFGSFFAATILIFLVLTDRPSARSVDLPSRTVTQSERRLLATQLPEAPVFIDTIPPVPLEALRIEDLPSTPEDGSLRAAVAYKNHIIVSSNRHLLEYGRNGKLLRMTDPKTFQCPGGLTGDLAIEAEILYVACWNDGVYEIDMAANRIAYHFDASNGLENAQNLRLVLDGGTLWVGTFNGLAKIDRSKRSVRTYRDELGGHCMQYSVMPHARAHETWAVFNGDSVCGGGAARYRTDDDSWTYYGPETFAGKGAQHIDFERFIVSTRGVYATHTESAAEPGSETMLVLDSFDPDEAIWRRRDALPWNSPDPLLRFLPKPEEVTDAYAEDTPKGVVWHLRMVDGWTQLPPLERRYIAMTSIAEGQRFLLSTAGLERYGTGDAFPTLLVAQKLYGNGARFVTSDDGRYILGLADLIGDFGGDWFRTDAVVYDRVLKKGGSHVIRGQSGAAAPPAIGLLKDAEAYRLEKKASLLILFENEKAILSLDFPDQGTRP